jgi:hypothetical protein
VTAADATCSWLGTLGPEGRDVSALVFDDQTADASVLYSVKNKSKLVVSEDPASLERRYIERQRAARIEAANRAIGAVALEVDKLADQVYIHPFFHHH